MGTDNDAGVNQSMNDIIGDIDEKDDEIKTEDTETEDTKNNKEEIIEISVKELDELKKLNSEYLDHLQRLQADFDNFKKLMARQRAELIDYANAELISEMIDIMENIERGIISAKESEDTGSIIKGMEIVYSQLKDILTSKGLERIEAVGNKFDPYYHEAMMKTFSEEYPNNTVIEEFQRGYKIKKKVLRYVKVRVSVNDSSE